MRTSGGAGLSPSRKGYRAGQGARLRKVPTCHRPPGGEGGGLPGGWAIGVGKGAGRVARCCRHQGGFIEGLFLLGVGKRRWGW